MAGSFGWQLILFSAVFYSFLFFILTSGGAKYLVNNVQNSTALSTGTYNTTYSTVDVNSLNYIQYVWQNPFSNIGWLAWISISLLIADIYIIVSSLIP